MNKNYHINVHPVSESGLTKITITNKNDPTGDPVTVEGETLDMAIDKAIESINEHERGK